MQLQMQLQYIQDAQAGHSGWTSSPSTDDHVTDEDSSTASAQSIEPKLIASAENLLKTKTPTAQIRNSYYITILGKLRNRLL